MQRHRILVVSTLFETTNSIIDVVESSVQNHSIDLSSPVFVDLVELSDFEQFVRCRLKGWQA